MSNECGPTEVPGVVKLREGVLINTDNQALAAYKNRKRREKNVDKMQDDIDSLKDDLQEIKEMLKKVLK